MNREVQEILKSFEPYYEKAEKEGLWFHAYYQNLWFSPSELKAKQVKGDFCWGIKNWELRDPKERLLQLEKEIDNAKREYESFKERVEIDIQLI